MDVLSSRIPGRAPARTIVLDATEAERPFLSGFLHDPGGAFAHIRRDMRPRFDPLGYYAVEGATIVPPRHAAFAGPHLLLDQALRVAVECTPDNVAMTTERSRVDVEAFKAGGEEPERLAGEVLIASTMDGHAVWGHWLIHQVPRILLFCRLFPHGRVAVPEGHFGTSFVAALRCFGVPAARLVPVSREKAYRVECAILMDYLYGESAIHPHAVKLLRKGVRHAKSRPDFGAIPSPGPRLLIERAGRSRRIGNGAELAGAAARFGFTQVRLGAAPLLKQARAWDAAEAVAAVLGSDLTNMIFAGPGLRVGAFSPSWFPDRFFADLASAWGLSWHEAVCPDELGERRLHKSFHVEPALAERLFAAMTAQA